MEIDKLLDLAHEEFRSGELEKAKKHCSGLRLDGNNESQALLLLSSIFCTQNNMDKAEYYSKMMIEKYPLSEQSYHSLADVYKKKKEFAKAIEYYEKAVKIQPHYVDSYISLASIYMDMDDFEAAIHTCVTCLHYNPNAYHVRCHLGNLLLKQNRLQEAKACYLKTLETKPDLGIALNNLGYIFHFQKEIWLAVHYFEKATKLDPNFGEAHLNLAQIFKELKLYDNALQSYMNVLTLNPAKNEVLLNIGEIHFKKGNQVMAINAYKQAIQANPNLVDAHCMIGRILKETGDAVEAETYCMNAIQLCPTHVNSLTLLGQLHLDKAEYSNAVNVLKMAADLQPNDPFIHNLLGLAYKEQGLHSLAIASFETTIRADPTFVDVYFNMSYVYREIRDFSNALQCFAKLHELGVCSPLYYCNIGHVFKELSQFENAIENYKLAIQFQKFYPEAFCSLVHCFISICCWDTYDSMLSVAVSMALDSLRNNQLVFIHPHHSFLFPLSNEEVKLIAQQHANICSDKNKHLMKPPYEFVFDNNARLKIGYVSSDFGDHPTSHLIQSIPGFHDRNRFEIFCYALSPDDNTTFRKKISQEAEHFVDVSNIPSNQEVADMIHRDGIQILLNLNGYTRGARNEIFAMKPAPIQVMYLGYPGTSGSKYMDFIITDKTTTPFELADAFSENLAYIPNTFFIGDHKQMFSHMIYKIVVVSDPDSIRDTNIVLNTKDISLIEKYSLENPSKQIVYVKLESLNLIKDMITNSQPSIVIDDLKLVNGVCTKELGRAATGEIVPADIIVTSRQQYGIPEDSIVFANFNQLYKIDPEIFEVWMSILKSVPKSILWLLRFPCLGEPHIRNAAKKYEVENDRIIFTDIAQKEEHVRRGQLVDVCLDTVKCNGHTTCMDILWSGTPVVTMPGKTMASRIAASQLNALGCPELIATDREDYKNIAVKLGTDREYLNSVRKKVWIHRNIGPLFDCQEYVSNLEELFVYMWKLQTECETDETES